MRTEIKSLFEQLITGQGQARDDACARLAMLLERYVRGRRDDQTHRLVLSDDLLAITLSGEEKTELVQNLGNIVMSENVPLSCRAALAGDLAMCGRLDGLEIALRFFGKVGNRLDEDSAYSILASITPTLSSSVHRQAICRMVTENHIEDVLHRLSAQGSSRLAEQIERLKRVINQIKTEVVGREIK